MSIEKKPDFGIVNACIFAVLFLRGAGYWLFSYLIYPHVPASVHGIFRYFGDFSYDSGFRSLADLNFGEPNIFEHAGEGLLAFPFISIAPVSLAIRLFGNFGIPLVDVAFTFLSYWVFYSFFKLFFENRTLAKLTSLAIVSNLAQYITTFFWQLSRALPFGQHRFEISLAILCVGALSAGMAMKSARPKRFLWVAFSAVAMGILVSSGVWPQASVLWGMRLPRPLITDVFVFGFLNFFLRGLRAQSPREARVMGALSGAALGFTLQGNYHSAAILGIFTCILAGIVFFKRDSNGKHMRDFFASLAGAFVISIIPLLMQRLFSGPEQYANLGEIQVPRWQLHFLTDPGSWLGAGFALVAVASFYVASLPSRQKDHRFTVVTLSALIAAGFFALPLSILITGKTVQVSQFPQRLQIYLGFVFFILLGLAIERMLRTTAKTEFLRRMRLPALSALLLCMGVSAAGISYRSATKTDAIRDSFFQLGPEYKPSFIELAQFFENVPKGQVLATVDAQVYAWWRLYKDGYSFLADPFFTTVGSQEMEIRMAQFMKLFGFTFQDYQKMLDDSYLTIFWFGHLKYEVTHVLVSGDFTGYSAEQIANIRKNSDFFSTWDTVIPQVELSRLQRDYDNMPPSLEGRRLDYIVMSKDKFFANAHVVNGQFVKVLDNKIFAVWQRRE